MTEKKIKISPVSSYSLPVVIKCEDLRGFGISLDIAFGKKVSNIDTN